MRRHRAVSRRGTPAPAPAICPASIFRAYRPGKKAPAAPRPVTPRLSGGRRITVTGVRIDETWYEPRGKSTRASVTTLALVRRPMHGTMLSPQTGFLLYGDPAQEAKGGPPICCFTVPGCGREIKLTGGVKFVTAELAQRGPQRPGFPGFLGFPGLAQRSQQTRLAACFGRGVARERR